MAHVVFILGAGVSRAAGAPLMHDFLDTAERLHRLGNLDDANADCELVFKGLSELQRVAFKAQLDFTNLEAVFTAFEMAALLGRLGSLAQADVVKLPDAMRTLIEATLEETIKFPHSRQIVPGFLPEPHNDFRNFVKTVKALYEKGRKMVAVLTFNYDACVEFALEHAGLAINYGWGETQDGVTLLKLHGSLLWTRCAECGHKSQHSVSDIVRNKYQHEEVPAPIRCRSAVLDARTCDCTAGTKKKLLIVPPTWNKGTDQAALEEVWKMAADELTDAKHIFVIGYSLPQTDTFFRNLFAIGTVGESWLNSFDVFDPAGGTEQQALCDRFRSILGHSATERFRFNQATFHDAQQAIPVRLSMMNVIR